MKNLTLILIMLFFSIASNAQRIHGSTGFHMPKDKVKLKNGDSETGKVIYSDSSKILLLKYDHSEKNILRKDIDTIVGLSYFTYFFSASIGILHWNGLINQRLDTFSRDASNFVLKFGYMRKRHFAVNGELSSQNGNKHKLSRIGLGIRRYFFSDYTKKKNFYLGINFGYNMPKTNMNNFFDLGWCFGYEYHLQNKYRLFLEYNRMAAQKYTPHPVSTSLNLGIRFSIEYKNYYTLLNQNIPKLPQ